MQIYYLWTHFIYAGLEKSTRPLAFASNIPGRACRFFASLAQLGECFPPGPKWSSCLNSLTLVSESKTICLTSTNFYSKKHESRLLVLYKSMSNWFGCARPKKAAVVEESSDSD